jgi:hypothetical protein
VGTQEQATHGFYVFDTGSFFGGKDHSSHQSREAPDMQRFGNAPRVAAHFSLAFVSIEIRFAPPPRPAVVSRAEQIAARADLARTLDGERRRAEARLLQRG